MVAGELVASKKNRGWDGWNGLAVKGEQVGGESMQVGDGRGGWRGLEKRKEKKRKKKNGPLHWALV